MNARAGHTSPTRERENPGETLSGTSGWYRSPSQARIGWRTFGRQSEVVGLDRAVPIRFT
jgi:hypothetical protein